jgi:hypothetical protein
MTTQLTTSLSEHWNPDKHIDFYKQYYNKEVVIYYIDGYTDDKNQPNFVKGILGQIYKNKQNLTTVSIIVDCRYDSNIHNVNDTTYEWYRHSIGSNIIKSIEVNMHHDVLETFKSIILPNTNEDIYLYSQSFVNPYVSI